MKNHRSVFVAALAAVSIAPVCAHAGLLTFDDNNPGDVGYNPLPTSYHGLTWTNWATIDSLTYGPSGYTNGVVSAPSVACGCAADFGQSTDTISGTSFTLKSGYFTSAWNDGESLLIQGFQGATQVASTTVTINTEGPLLVTFDSSFSNLTSVEFTPSGGTPTTLLGSGEYFALDSLDVTTGVPEPASWAVMLLGLAGVGGMLRSRRRSVGVAA